MSKTVTARRNFLKSSIASLTSSVALAYSAKLVAAENEQQDHRDIVSSGQGYRETRHIRKYYQHARF